MTEPQLGFLLSLGIAGAIFIPLWIITRIRGRKFFENKNSSDTGGDAATASIIATSMIDSGGDAGGDGGGGGGD